MKITPVLPPNRPNDSAAQKVTSKKDSGGFSDMLDQQTQQDQKDEDREPETHEVSDEKISDAIESFVADSELRAKGLTAEQQGQGPGLTVLLKDNAGKVLRSMSGKEFLKLRDTVDSSKEKRGKLIDQKF